MIPCPQPACDREFSRANGLSRHLRESHGVYRNENEAFEPQPEPQSEVGWVIEAGVEDVDEVDTPTDWVSMSFDFNDSEMQTLEALAFLNRSTPGDEANRLLTDALEQLAGDSDVVALLVAREEVSA